MADKNFIVKNGLEVGGQEVVSSSGVVTSAALGGQTLASTDSPTFNNLTLTNDIAVGGDINLTGDLNITGDVNTLSVTDLDVTDQTITLGKGQVESASGGSGIVIDGSGASILWDETNDTFDINKGLNVDSDTFVVDNTNNRVGIGMSSPNMKVNISHADEDGLRFNVADGAASFIDFGDVSDNDIGRISYDHADNHMAFRTNNAERMRINSSGNLEFNAFTTHSSLGNVSISIPDRAATLYNVGDRGNITIQASSATSGAQAMSGGRVLINAGNSNNGQSGDIILSSGVNVLNSNDRGKIRFNVGGRTTNEEVMRIHSDLNVGIGTADPDAKLEVAMTRTSSTSGIVLQLSDNVTGVQTDGVYKAIRSASNAGNSISEIRFLETDGTNNNTSISFATAAVAGGLTERVRINQLGNVGIGTSSPKHDLVVHNDSGPFIALVGDSYNDEMGIVFNGGDLTNASSAGNTGAKITSQLSVNGGQVLGDLRFITNSGDTFVDSMYIDTSGNVGIGTTSPLSNNKLHVNGTVHIGNGEDYSSYAKLAVYDDVYQGDVGLLIKNDRYNDSSATASLIFEHRTHAGQGHAAKIVCRRQGAYNESAGSKDAALDFYTANGGTYSHRMQIDRDGRVGIGTGTSGISYPFIVQSGTTDQQLRLANASSNISTMHAGFGCNPSTDITIQTQGHGALWRFGANVSNGNAYWINSNNVGVNFASGSNAWSAHSDERLKENITDIGPVLDKIQNYRCVSFNFKSSPEKELIGFIAQDWETDFPEVVDEDDAFTIQDDGSLVEKNKEENTSDIKVKSIAYTETIPILLKAIQEQQTIIDDLKSRLDEAGL